MKVKENKKEGYVLYIYPVFLMKNNKICLNELKAWANAACNPNLAE